MSECYIASEQYMFKCISSCRVHEASWGLPRLSRSPADGGRASQLAYNKKENRALLMWKVCMAACKMTSPINIRLLVATAPRPRQLSYATSGSRMCYEHQILINAVFEILSYGNSFFFPTINFPMLSVLHKHMFFSR